MASMRSLMDRRRLLTGSAGLGLLGLGGCAAGSLARSDPAAPRDRAPQLALVQARNDRLFDITVCLRPFRAAGPRLDTEQIGDSLIVHNYGHGGSGWSLSWGSGALAVEKAMAAGPREIAVVGCGALGLTAALLAQRAGARVTIYAKDLLPQTRSSRATGVWSPDSRIALAQAAGPDFPALWEKMARTSFKQYRNYLGLPGAPVEWIDHYLLTDAAPQHHQSPPGPDGMEFARYQDGLVGLAPGYDLLAPGATAFPTAYVRKSTTMMFNIADYGHTLMSDFLLAGGKIERREFHRPAEIAALLQKVVINCPGYGARDLWKDESLTPVRGQIAWLIPQPEVNYGLVYGGVSMLPRRDGIVVQALAGGDMRGYGDANETPDRAEAEASVATLAGLYSRFPRARAV